MELEFGEEVGGLMERLSCQKEKKKRGEAIDGQRMNRLKKDLDGAWKDIEKQPNRRQAFVNEGLFGVGAPLVVCSW